MMRRYKHLHISTALLILALLLLRWRWLSVLHLTAIATTSIHSWLIRRRYGDRSRDLAFDVTPEGDELSISTRHWGDSGEYVPANRQSGCTSSSARGIDGDVILSPWMAGSLPVR